MKKRILIIAGLALLIAFLIAGGLFVHRVGQALSAMKPRKMPDELKIAKIVRGTGQFSKEVLFAEADLGVITDFQQRANRELAVVGQNGVAILSDGGLATKRIHFNKCYSEVVSVEVGSGAFLCRGAWNVNTTLFDIEGKTVWSYGSGLPGIDDAAAGSVGPNASKRVVVGFNGGGGVRLLSAEGKELWKRDDGNVWHVEIAADKSGNVILHSNAKGQLIVRDADGNVLGRYEPEVYLASFAMTAWGDEPDLNKLITSDEGSIYILTTDGKTLVRLPAPDSAAMATTKGTRVHFSAKMTYFAGLLRYSLWNRSLLYIYDG